MKKKIEKIETEVNATTNSTNPVVLKSISLEQISPLELETGRTDLNLLVDKVNEIIKKVNQNV